MRPEGAGQGGGECEAIEILDKNSAYVPKLTQCASLLTQP
jgi:hypothetical protein